MSDMSLQKKKTVVLAAAIACFQMPAMLIVNHLHASRFLPAFVVCYALFMASLFAYVVLQLSKLMKIRRGAR